MKKILHKIKLIAPWLVAAAIFTYMFVQYPPAQVWNAVKHVNVMMFFGLSIGYFIIIFCVDSFVVARTLTRFGFPTKWKEMLPARGTTYLVMNINFPASQAMFAYYLKRTHGVPIFEAFSIFAFLTLIDFYWIITLGFIGSLLQKPMIHGIDLSGMIQIVALVSYAFLIIWLAYWRGWLAKISPCKCPHRFTSWIRRKRIFFIFNEATIKDYVKTATMRSPIYLMIIFFMYIAISAFNAHIPFVNILSSTPIAFLIGTVPITPGGIGTSNVALIELLCDHITGPVFSQTTITPRELIFAVSLLWLFTNYFLKTVVGVYFLRKTSKELFKPIEDTDKIMTEEASNIHVSV